MQVFVSIKNKSGNFEAQLIKDIQGIATRDVEKLAKKHEDVIQNVIEQKTEQSTGKLASSWQAGEMNIPGKIAWGVGDIDFLNTNAKGWRHLNYGSVAIGANWQHILPKGRWVNGRWVESEDGYFATPKTPIKPLNYIEASMLMMEPFIQQVLAEGRK